MGRAAAFAGVLVVLLCACSEADQEARTNAARPMVWARMSETLRVAGPVVVVEEVPEPPVSVGPAIRAGGNPDHPPEARLPLVAVTSLESATPAEPPDDPDPVLPVRVPWTAPTSDDDEPAFAWPQRIPLPERVVAIRDPASGPRRLGGPCCNTPCGASSRGLARLLGASSSTSGLRVGRPSSGMR